ncbi:hypothetical protein TH25_17100 [Thalassospira profundimaris]|uniref:Uncharacterized protein n=1 Tax=Thalassospira profundimaris TaxID=502049 RepID=A0A367WZM3_9PROT|nr:hypothetical protein [Thalassospira profundimaris]RCK45961.1 hypothetical protein TH25_17100 [Thalassospira profundimaris]
MRFACRSALRGLAVLSFAACSIANAATAVEYEVRAFDGGPAWFVYDEPVDVALHVLNPGDPKCHELGEIVLLFENRDQLRDDALIETAALTGMNHYAELCRSLGANPSNQRKVAGIIVGNGAPDAQGRVMGDARVLDAMVSSFTGAYQLRIRRNTVAAGGADDAAAAIIADRDARLAAAKAEREAADRARANERAAEIAEIRATYNAALAESVAQAQPAGLIGRVTGGDRAALTGVWSASQSDCANESVILFERDGAGTVEWWRASNQDVGLLPWRTGRWELRDGTVIMSFNHRVEYDRFRQDLQSGVINETVQFDLKDVDGSELRLAATSGGFSPEALFLGGAEKLFVRCRD